MTQSEETKTSLIAKDISYIQKDIADIKSGIKELAGVYATREQLVDVAKDTEKRLLLLEGANSFSKWLSPLLSATLGSVLTFLLIQYIMSSK